jgi:hypothetical protein
MMLMLTSTDPFSAPRLRPLNAGPPILGLILLLISVRLG